MDQHELIQKIYDYRNDKTEKLDWPYHALLNEICGEIISIIDED